LLERSCELVIGAAQSKPINICPTALLCPALSGEGSSPIRIETTLLKPACWLGNSWNWTS
jgi:hypothetical protein